VPRYCDDPKAKPEVLCRDEGDLVTCDGPAYDPGTGVCVMPGPIEDPKEVDDSGVQEFPEEIQPGEKDQPLPEEPVEEVEEDDSEESETEEESEGTDSGVN